MIDTNILFAGGSPAAQGIGQGYELFRQEQQRAIENSAAATTAAQNAERLAMDRQTMDMAGQQNQRAATEFDVKLQDLARARQQDHIKQTASQVSSLLGRGDTKSALAVLQKSMLDAQSVPELGGLADDYAQFGEMLAAGDVQTVKNQADAVMSAFTQNTAAQSEFNALTTGLSPADKMKAQRIQLGLDARAVTAAKQIVMVGDVPFEWEPTTGSLTPARIDSTGVELTAQDVGAMSGEVKAGEAAGQEKGQTTEARRTERIAVGKDAASAYPGLVRAMTLLQTVETGGWSAVSNRIKSDLGLIGADEAELNYLLATNVIKNLKPTFGAAFTAKEGEWLEKIEAGFGKNNAANLRIIKSIKDRADKYAKQAIEDAVAIQDFATAQAIKNAMAGDVDLTPTPTVDDVLKIYGGK